VVAAAAAASGSQFGVRCASCGLDCKTNQRALVVRRHDERFFAPRANMSAKAAASRDAMAH